MSNLAGALIDMMPSASNLDRVDYSTYNRSQFIVQIKDAVGYMLGLNRGAVKDSFVDKATACVGRHWPMMVKSDLRRFVEADEAIIPVAAKKHTEVGLAFADLLATLVSDGYPDSTNVHDSAREGQPIGSCGRFRH